MRHATFKTQSLVALALLSCQRPHPREEAAEAPFQPQQVAQLAHRSSDELEKNEAGLISPQTLLRWLSDWKNQRPKDIEGDLIVLQLSPATEDAASPQAFVASSENVRVYHAVELPMLLQVRSNGVVALGESPGRGIRVDSFLRRYRIRPSRDFVLMATGRVHEGGLETLAKAWATFRYWGMSHASLGILNGSVDAHLPTEFRSGAALPAPIDGDERVSQLGQNHLAILATLSDIQEAIAENRFLVDVRSEPEFLGQTVSKHSTEDTCLAGPPQCTSVYSGRIRNALHWPTKEFIDLEQGIFRSPVEIEGALKARGLGGQHPIYFYGADSGQSALAVFAALAVVGVPAHWYATGFVEWGSLNASHPEAGLQNLPETSLWRNDTPERMEAYRPLGTVSQAARPLILAPHALSAQQVKEVDLEYLRAPPPLPGPGAGAGDSDCVNSSLSSPSPQ